MKQGSLLVKARYIGTTRALPNPSGDIIATLREDDVAFFCLFVASERPSRPLASERT